MYTQKIRRDNQGCQMVSFQTKNPNLGKFWRAIDWKMFLYFMAILEYFQTFGIFYDHWVHFVFIWYIFPVWVIFTKKNLATLGIPLKVGLETTKELKREKN
jgi:hypothetical protein